MPYVYRHIRLDTNEPFYIGIGSDDSYKRAYSKRNRNNYWQNVIAKTCYRVEIVMDDLAWSAACDKEKEFIKIYRSLGLNLVNLTDGGEGLLNPSSEVRKKIAKGVTGAKNGNFGKPWTESRKIGMHVRMLGKNNPNYGKAITTDHKLKIASAQFGREKTESEKNAIYSKTRKQVINMQNGIYYDSILAAAYAAGVKDYTMTRWLKKSKSNYKLL